MTVANPYSKNARKRTSGAALLFNSDHELLILKAAYKDFWTLPGGSGELKESPKTTCFREVREEIGLEIPDLKLLCVDYNYYHTYDDECIHFIFNGGTLAEEQIQSIKLQSEEIERYLFLPIKDTKNYLIDRLQKRVDFAIEALEKDSMFYIENGE